MNVAKILSVKFFRICILIVFIVDGAEELSAFTLTVSVQQHRSANHMKVLLGAYQLEPLEWGTLRHSTMLSIKSVPAC